MNQIENLPDKLIQFQVAFDIARAMRRDVKTRKEYTTSQFAEEYLNQHSSMVSKVLSGAAKSEPVLKAIAQFIVETDFNFYQLEELKSLANRLSEE
jgi:hypothetical protein